MKTKLEKLGIDYNEDQTDIQYHIKIDENQVSNSKKAKKHFTKIVNSLAKDLKKQYFDFSSKKLNISIDEQYLQQFKTTVNELSTKAKKQSEKKINGDAIVFYSSLIAGGIAGAATGLILGHHVSLEIVKGPIENMVEANYNSILLDFALCEALGAIPILGAALSGPIGAGVLGAPSMAIKYSYNKIRYPLANNVNEYESLDKALETIEAETIKDK